MPITKSERNEVFTTIKNAGLDPSTCKLTKNNVRRLIVKHPVTGSSFEIYQRRWIDRDRFYVKPYVPVLLIAASGASLDESYQDWDDLIIALRSWAELVLRRQDRVRQIEEQRKAEERIPDFWTLASDWDLPESRDIENTPFTSQEQDVISRELRVIKKYVKEHYELSDANFARIEERLDEAEEASHRLGRKDWLLLFGGVVLTLIVTDLVPPVVVEHVFNGVVHGLAHLFGTASGRGMIET